MNALLDPRVYLPPRRRAKRRWPDPTLVAVAGVGTTWALFAAALLATWLTGGQ